MLICVAKRCLNNLDTGNKMSLRMTTQERKAFLADVYIGTVGIADEGRGSLTVLIWYAYDSRGDLRIMTGRESRKGHQLARAGSTQGIL